MNLNCGHFGTISLIGRDSRARSQWGRCNILVGDFNPSEKISINFDDYFQYKKCSKPPTSLPNLPRSLQSPAIPAMTDQLLRCDRNSRHFGAALPQPRAGLQRRLGLGLCAAAHTRQGHGWSLQRLQEGNLDWDPWTSQKLETVSKDGIYQLYMDCIWLVYG